MLWNQRASCNGQKRIDFLKVVEIRLFKNIKGLLPVWHSRQDWRCVSSNWWEHLWRLGFQWLKANSAWKYLGSPSFLYAYQPIWAELGEQPALKELRITSETPLLTDFDVCGNLYERRWSWSEVESLQKNKSDGQIPTRWLPFRLATPLGASTSSTPSQLWLPPSQLWLPPSQLWLPPSQLWLLKTQSDVFFHFGARPSFRGELLVVGKVHNYIIICVFDLPRFLYESVDFPSWVSRKSS